MQRELAYLLDILQSARMIQAFVGDMDEAAFHKDIKTQDAVIRRIEVIGEAVRRLSLEFRENHPQIPWQQIAGMRSKLIHEYDRVDLVAVWEVVQHDIGMLIAQIEPLVPPDDSDESE
ncbi:MAG: DUF86 domain-containing protein [Chloroflexi bacterium]|nr:MAG: DUF86 domain-containing protein [Chloroflexota bacterium]